MCLYLVFIYQAAISKDAGQWFAFSLSAGRWVFLSPLEELLPCVLFYLALDLIYVQALTVVYLIYMSIWARAFDIRLRPGGADGDVHLAPQPEFVTEIMHSPRPSPSTGEGTRQRAQRWECTPMTTRSFTLARETFLNPRLPERCLAGDGPGRLIAIEVEA